MDELTAIAIALGALFGALILLGWAYGDFNRPKQPPTTDQTRPTSSS